MSIIPFRFDHVDNFSAVRKFSGVVDLIIAEDNEATIKILIKGRFTKLRHVHRPHRVNIDWLYEVFSSTNYRCRLRYVSTKRQIADMHTKAITKADCWTHLTKLAQLINTPSVLFSMWLKRARPRDVQNLYAFACAPFAL